MTLKTTYQMTYHSSNLDREAVDFIHKWHYSKSARSQQQKHVFKLINVYNQSLEGIAIYGTPMSRHIPNDFIELRRLCLIDNTPRNAESFFIAKTLKWLEHNTDYRYVISFADPNRGHSGTIYKASNFQYDGEEKNGNPRVLKIGDKSVHLRQFYQKKDGQYTDDALRYQEMVRKGEAEIMKQEKKLRYIYDLQK